MPNQKIPCCMHPTQVILIDDNQKYLTSLILELDVLRATYLPFYDPAKALKFLNNDYSADPFVNRCLIHPHDKYEENPEKRTINVNYRAIYSEIYREQRFAEISVVIADYAMPGTDGITFFERLHDKGFKRILLTGEAEDTKAIEGFNKGVIHKFVRKDDPNFQFNINNAIAELQMQYFNDLSRLIVDSGLNYGNADTLNILSDEVFVSLFNTIKQENNIIEYYLLDKHGSFLLLDIRGNPSWLFVLRENELEEYYHFAKLEEAPHDIISALKDKKVVPYFHAVKDLQTPPANWKSYLYPAKKLIGKHNYYYAYVTKQRSENLKLNDIVYYQDYLEKF